MRILQEIIGKEILNESAVIVGRVKDIEVNVETNEIEAFIVSKGGISESLGLSGNELVIPFSLVKQIGDKVLLENGVDYTI